jgi:ADP-ribose pyrophosphatase
MSEFEKGRLLNRNNVYSGKIVQLVVDKISLFGTDHTREVIKHPGGVVFLAKLQDGTIPFVRQFRYPMQRPLLELPAGRIDPGEEPSASAVRELEEETGWSPRTIEHVSSFYATPGYCDEILHLFYSDSLRETPARPEPDEQLVIEYYTLEEALALAVKGEIQDGKTLVALFWLGWKENQPV